MSLASFSAAASAAISCSSMALGVAVTWLARPPRSEMLTALVSHAYASGLGRASRNLVLTARPGARGPVLEALPGRLGGVHLAVVGETVEAGCRGRGGVPRGGRVALSSRGA